jgi:hypothetical protein
VIIKLKDYNGNLTYSVVTVNSRKRQLKMKKGLGRKWKFVFMVAIYGDYNNM